MHLPHSVLQLATEFALNAVSETIWFLALGFALYAAWIDWRTRRIPNWLTVSGFLIGMVANTIPGGWHGAKASLEGVGLALGLLLPVVLLRGLGAGDWKLMGAIGALVGWRAMLFVMLTGFFVSALMGVVQMIAARRVKQTLRNMASLAMGLATFGLRADLAEISLDNPTLLKIPFGTAVGVAMVLSFALAHWPW